MFGSSHSFVEMAVTRPRRALPKSSRAPATDSDIIFKASSVGLLLVSLVSLVIGCFYAYPFVVDAQRETIRKLSTVVSGWVTPSSMFLLMILLVGAVAVSNGMLKLSKRGKRLHLKEDEDREEVEEDHHQVGKLPVVHERPHESKKHDLFAEPGPRQSHSNVDIKPSVSGRPGAKRPTDFPRIVRSKSEKVKPLTKTELVDHHRHKSGTFGPTFRKDSGKTGVVVVDDPPEAEANAASDEVDKKADDFISKFYQNMKLQRLESLIRNKNRTDRSNG